MAHHQVPLSSTPRSTGAEPSYYNGIHQQVVVSKDGTRILCLADIRGDLSLLNTLAASARASIVIHTGDFGFYDDNSLLTISEKTLRHVVQYSPLIPENVKKQLSQLPVDTRAQTVLSPADLTLSQFPRFLHRELSLSVPVYTVWGSCEDVAVLEKLRAGIFKIPNLHVIDEAYSRLLTVGGVKLRLFGLGGAMVMHRLFDVGEGRSSIAGGQGTMWTTILQMGELLDTAARVYDPSETRVLVTHASPSREGLLIQLASALKADLTISAGLHFRYGSSYNEFSTSPSQAHYARKLVASRAAFDDVWETVEPVVREAVVGTESQQKQLGLALEMIQSMPQSVDGAAGVDDGVFKITWNFNLADASYGSLVLNVVDGRIATEMRSEGFSFGHRAAHPTPLAPPQQQASHTIAANPSSSNPPPQSSGPSSIQDVPPKGFTPDVVLLGTAAPAQGLVSDVTILTRPNKATTPKAQTSAPEAAKTSSAPPVDSQSNSSLFVRFAKDESEALSVFDEQDKAIAKISRYGVNYVVAFSTIEETKSALDRIPEDHKYSGTARPTVAPFRTRPNFASNGGGNMGASTNWDSESEPRRTGGRGRGRGGRGRGKQ